MYKYFVGLNTANSEDEEVEKKKKTNIRRKNKKANTNVKQVLKAKCQMLNFSSTSTTL